MRTRADLEARIWAITGRDLTGATVDAIIDVCEEYAADRQPRQPRVTLHHASGTDLWPIIGPLADALLNESDVSEPAPPPLKLVRGAA